MSEIKLVRKLRRLTEISYNTAFTHLPSHTIRLGMLRLAGARIGRSTSIFRGTTILGCECLSIGDKVSIGFRCMLDARGGLSIGDRTVVASDTHIITASHDINSPTFAAWMSPVTIGEYVWIASRATVLPGVVVGNRAVVAACALVQSDVSEGAVVGGIPAKPIGERMVDLDYDPTYRPIFY